MDFQQILEEAKNRDDILGLILTGSRGKGFENEHSDYDIKIIATDGSVSDLEKRYAETENADVSVRTLSDFKAFAEWGSPESWDRYDFAHIKILVDKTGELQKLTEEKGYIPKDKQAAFIDWCIDAYVNSVYRSVKCIRNGNTFGAHIEAANSMLDFLALLFALNGRHRPFLGYVAKELEAYPLKRSPWSASELVAKIQKILETANLKTQQELLIDMEKLCRDMGHGHMFDGWEGKDKWAMTFKPPAS
jgi:hypothetical protein